MMLRLNQVVKVALVAALAVSFVACSGKKKKAPIRDGKTRPAQQTPAQQTPTVQPTATQPTVQPTATGTPQVVIPTAANPRSTVIVSTSDGTVPAVIERVAEEPATVVTGTNTVVHVLPSNGAIAAPDNGVGVFPTGAADERRRAFSDSRVDTLLPILKGEVDKLPEDLRTASESFALAIRSVSIEANEGNRKVFAEIIFDGPAGPVSAKFRGHLDVNNRAVMDESAETSGDDFVFKASVVCLDANMESCENTVIRIDQFTKSGEICKTAFAVHRIGNVHVQFPMRDYQKSLKSMNDEYKEFMLYMKNTHDAVQAINACRMSGNNNCMPPPMRAPGANDVEFRSFAVAYGRSAFTLTFWSVTTIEKPEQDVLVISGPLMLADDARDYQANLGVNGFLRETTGRVTNDQGKFENYISRVKLLSNDGNGNMVLQVHLKGVAENTLLTITSEILEARDFMYLLQKQKN
ncbi:MAG: PT domain-containing protein [Bdellovibrionaceae bacterium]|nr:PT domain-containing protein [Bdellovibrionales bacterium]MCB9085256.1 PT domain-containing protein [Pseudobdellovibrionaceae bacterium]